MLKRSFRVVLAIALISCLAGLAGCNAGGGDAVSTSTATGTTSAATSAASAAAIILSSSNAAIKPDGSNSTTITATVVDANRLPVSGVTVNFSVASGTLGISSGVSTASGIVTISYSAASSLQTVELSERTETITAKVVDTTISAQIPIRISLSPVQISLGTSSPTVKSDGSTSATITATVVDSSNIPVVGTTVTFTKQTGQLGASSGVSSAAGIVTIPFSAVDYDKNTAAPIDKTNRTETISATAPGATSVARIPMQVVGSTLTLTPSQTNMLVGGAISLSARTYDASGVTGVGGQSLRFSIPAGKGSLSGGSGASGTAISQIVTTAGNGTAPAITFTSSVAGTVVVSVEWLNAAGTVTLTESSAIIVDTAGISFAVTSPASAASKPANLALGGSQVVSVSVPSAISGAAVAKVRFSTNMGNWSDSSKVRTVVPAANVASETLASGAYAGIGNVQIDALDASGTTLATLNQLFALSAPASAAGMITLQTSVSNIAPSIGGNHNSATLTATVRTAGGGNAVGGSPVLFEILNTTGSGEQLSNVLVNTDSSGQAETRFYSGPVSTVGGVKVKASVLDTNLSDTKTLFVNASAVSISIGQGSTLDSVDNDVDYRLPMSIMVVDNSGVGVGNVLVTLTAFPLSYYSGHRGQGNFDCTPTYTGTHPNEDDNENNNLDPGEDLNGDGMITPPQAAAGTVPSTVTTDANGVAGFNLTYQKKFASWVQTRIRARVAIATGTTESTNEVKFVLLYSSKDSGILTRDDKGNPTSGFCSLPGPPLGW